MTPSADLPSPSPAAAASHSSAETAANTIPTGPASPAASSFEQAATEETPGFVTELIDFLKHNKKWWLAPILVALALAAALVMLSGSALAPFIYPLF